MIALAQVLAVAGVAYFLFLAVRLWRVIQRERGREPSRDTLSGIFRAEHARGYDAPSSVEAYKRQWGER